MKHCIRLVVQQVYLQYNILFMNPLLEAPWEKIITSGNISPNLPRSVSESNKL
jgi:hypothetical protein